MSCPCPVPSCRDHFPLALERPCPFLLLSDFMHQTDASAHHAERERDSILHAHRHGCSWFLALPDLVTQTGSPQLVSARQPRLSFCFKRSEGLQQYFMRFVQRLHVEPNRLLVYSSMAWLCCSADVIELLNGSRMLGSVPPSLMDERRRCSAAKESVRGC